METAVPVSSRPAPARVWTVRVALALPPALAAFWVAGTQVHGGPVWPWHPAMADLEVYRRTGQLLLSGGDIFHTDGLLWIYPGFAALFTFPLALLTDIQAAALWTVLCTAALAAVVHRMGFVGWRLSALTTASILFTSPVRETLGQGQLGLFIVAAVVLDAMPGPRLFRRRVLPEGWLVGVVTAVKLTPAAVAAYQFFAGRRKAAWVAFGSFLAATAIGFVLLPSESAYYWTKLALGDTGMNKTLIYAANQSIVGMWARLTGSTSAGGLMLSLAALVLGIWAAVLIHRSGRVELAICTAGVASLLASPISWGHHYVWLIPLAIVLWRGRDLPGWFRWYGLAWVAWGLVAPYMWLPRGGDVELAYTFWQEVVVNAGIVGGVIFLVAAVAGARRPGREAG
jgi:alpha-1,2-mannosyltransferase